MLPHTSALCSKLAALKRAACPQGVKPAPTPLHPEPAATDSSRLPALHEQAAAEQLGTSDGSDSDLEAAAVPSGGRVDAAFAIAVTVLLVAATKILVQLIAGPAMGEHWKLDLHYAGHLAAGAACALLPSLACKQLRCAAPSRSPLGRVSNAGVPAASS